MVKGRMAFLAVVIFSFFLTALSFAAEEGAVKATGAVPGEAIEMQMISFNLMIQEAVSGVIAGDAKSVLQAVEPALGNMDKVHAALKSGSKLKKNAGKMKDFDSLDKKFQTKLVALRDAAKKKDQKGMLKGTAGVIEACANCHQKFK